MVHVYVDKHKLPIGNYITCAECKHDWSIFYMIVVRGKELILCPDCYEKLKKEINNI